MMLPIIFIKMLHSSKLYEINTSIPFATTGKSPVKVPIFGAVPANSTPVSTGDYKDTLLVSVTF